MDIQKMGHYIGQVSQYMNRYLDRVGRCDESECELECSHQCQRELACEYDPDKCHGKNRVECKRETH